MAPVFYFSKHRQVSALLLSVVFLFIQFNALNGDIGNDDLLDEVMRETKEEQEAERATEIELDKIVETDIGVAKKAEQDAQDLSNRKNNIKPTSKSKTGFRSPQGASEMMKKRGVRDKVSSNSDRRSRVPSNSRPGIHSDSNAGITFEEYAASMTDEEDQDKVDSKDDMKRASGYSLLDEATRQLHHAHVSTVLKASGGGQSIYGDKGGGDWYKVLGVKKGESDISAIKRQYRKLALLLHPDKNLDPEAPLAFKILQEGYKVLGSDENRQEYNRKLAKRAKVRRQRVWLRVNERVQSTAGWIRYAWRKSRFIRSWPLLFLIIMFA